MIDKELEHYGVLGMKWGVRRTPEQLGHRTSTSKRKKRSNSLISKIKKEAEAKKKAKDSSEKEKRRKEILNDPGKLKSHYKEFSDDEIRDAIKNFETERKLSELSREKVRSAENWLSSIAKMTTSMVVVYNNSAKAYNAFFSDKDGNPTLPIIKNEEKKKKDKDQ